MTVFADGLVRASGRRGPVRRPRAAGLFSGLSRRLRWLSVQALSESWPDRVPGAPSVLVGFCACSSRHHRRASCPVSRPVPPVRASSGSWRSHGRGPRCSCGRSAHTHGPSGLIPSTRFGQLPEESVEYTPTQSPLVIEVDADVCFEHQRWRHATTFRGVGGDLQPADLTCLGEQAVTPQPPPPQLSVRSGRPAHGAMRRPRRPPDGPAVRRSGGPCAEPITRPTCQRPRLAGSRR